MTDRDLLKQALEALDSEATLNVGSIKDALRERLAQPEFDSALQSAAMTQTAPKLAQPEQEPKHDYRTRYDRGCYKCGSHYCPADCPEPTHLVPQQPEQSPLDRMAENARELGLDYEPVQEPVAWKDRTYGNLHHQDFGNSIPLYTTPPRREWVGLTEEEIKAMPQWFPSHENAAVMPLIRAIEAKLKEKNA